MSRLETIRNRSSRARKLDTAVAGVELRVAALGQRAPDWKLRWVSSVAARRTGKFRQSVA
jgi:hypothetical protein